MSITKQNTIFCDSCGKFCRPFDEYTPFGTKDYDSPEPLDPSHVCEKCFIKEKQSWLDGFRSGSRSGDWQKSRAEMEAAQECGLVWIHSNGIGKYGTPEYINYSYVSKDDPRLVTT